jgi:urea transport system ATP-binding protein
MSAQGVASARSDVIPAGTQTYALSTHGLSKRFGGLTAIDRVDLCVAEGELRCLIGPNGAGKTTLFNLVTGKLRPDAGRVYLFGEDITGWDVQAVARRGVGRKFQTPNVFEDLTVLDNLLVAAQSRLSMLPLLRSAGERHYEEVVSSTLEQIRLKEKRDYLAGALSHGEKQWLEIGMVLVSQPRLLLLDEPTAGMTPDETRETAHLLREIASAMTTVVIEHDLKFVREIGTQITVLHRGAILAEGPIDEIAANDMVRNVYLGRESL